MVERRVEGVGIYTVFTQRYPLIYYGVAVMVDVHMRPLIGVECGQQSQRFFTFAYERMIA